MAPSTVTTVDQNQAVLDYVRDRLDERTSAGQCILHLAPGGEIRRVEWRSIDKVEDIILERRGALP